MRGLYKYKILKSTIFDNSNDLCEFYRQLPENYTNIKSNAYEIVTYFGSTYNCDEFFSIMSSRKTAKSNRLSQHSLESCLRIKTYTDSIDLDSIINS